MDRAGIPAVDRLDTQQREVPLALLGRPDRAADRHPATKPEPADLAWRNINIIRPGQVALLGRAQEPEPVGHRLERALAVHDALTRRPRLEHLEDQVLLGDVLEILEALLLGDPEQLVELHPLELTDRELIALVQRALLGGDLLEFRRLALELLIARQHGVVVARVIVATTTAAAAGVASARRALALLPLAATTLPALALAASLVVPLAASALAVPLPARLPARLATSLARRLTRAPAPARTGAAVRLGVRLGLRLLGGLAVCLATGLVGRRAVRFGIARRLIGGLRRRFRGRLLARLAPRHRRGLIGDLLGSRLASRAARLRLRALRAGVLLRDRVRLCLCHVFSLPARSTAHRRLGTTRSHRAHAVKITARPMFQKGDSTPEPA